MFPALVCLAVPVAVAVILIAGACAAGKMARVGTVDHNTATVQTAVETEVDLHAKLTAALASIDALQGEVNGLKFELSAVKTGDISAAKTESQAGRDVNTWNVSGLFDSAALLFFYVVGHRWKLTRAVLDWFKGKKTE